LSNFLSTNFLNNVCLHFLTGKNPKYKKWFICIQLHINAVVKAVTQGIGTISISFSKASLIRIYQGSEIQGVPASLIKAIFFHSFNCSIILSVFVFPE